MTTVEARPGTGSAPRTRRAVTWTLTERQRFDLEMLAIGAFAPLQTYLDSRDYDSVCATMRLADGRLCPMPITLDLPSRTVAEIEGNERLHLCDEEGAILATLRVQDAWRPDLQREAELVYGTVDQAHAGVHDLLHT